MDRATHLRGGARQRLLPLRPEAAERAERARRVHVEVREPLRGAERVRDHLYRALRRHLRPLCRADVALGASGGVNPVVVAHLRLARVVSE